MIQIELQPEVEAQLTAEAQARGLALHRYVEQIVQSRTAEAARTHSVAEAIGRILALREETDGRGLDLKELINEGRKS